MSVSQLIKEAQEKGLDVYRHLAHKLFDVPYDDVSPEQRRAAKTLLYPHLYGQKSGTQHEVVT